MENRPGRRRREELEETRKERNSERRREEEEREEEERNSEREERNWEREEERNSERVYKLFAEKTREEHPLWLRGVTQRLTIKREWAMRTERRRTRWNEDKDGRRTKKRMSDLLGL